MILQWLFIHLYNIYPFTHSYSNPRMVPSRNLRCMYSTQVPACILHRHAQHRLNSVLGCPQIFPQISENVLIISSFPFTSGSPHPRHGSSICTCRRVACVAMGRWWAVVTVRQATLPQLHLVIQLATAHHPFHRQLFLEEVCETRPKRANIT